MIRLGMGNTYYPFCKEGAKKELFDQLYNLVKNCEEKNGMPLVICGAFCNTSAWYDAPAVEFETFDGCGLVACDDDIRNVFWGNMKDFRRELRSGARSFKEAFPEAFI